MYKILCVWLYIDELIDNIINIWDLSIKHIGPWITLCWEWFNMIYIQEWINLPKEYELNLICRLLKWWELIYDNKGDI